MMIHMIGLVDCDGINDNDDDDDNDNDDGNDDDDDDDDKRDWSGRWGMIHGHTLLCCC